jgi:chaperonin subunit
MNLQPLGDRLIVEVLDEVELTVSGIVLPDTAREKPQRGRVLAIGPPCPRRGREVHRDGRRRGRGDMPSARPCRAVSALGRNGWRRLPSRVLLLPPRREEAEWLALHPRCLCVQTANACRTGRAFVTLRPLASPPARKREDAGASPGSPSYPQLALGVRKAALVRGRT